MMDINTYEMIISSYLPLKKNTNVTTNKNKIIIIENNVIIDG